MLNSQSTSWAVQGLAAAGGGGTAIGRALGYLSRLRAADGHYRYSASSDQTPIWVTAQALLAAEQQPFPLPAVARSRAESGSGDSASEEAEQETDTAGEPATGSASSGADPAPGVGAGGGGSGAEVQGVAGGTGDEADTGPSPEDVSAAAGSADQEPAGTGESGDVPVSVSYPGDEGEDRTTAYLLGGIGILGLVLAGGYLWYRRRGP